MEGGNATVEQVWKERMAAVHLHHTREKIEILNALKARFGSEVAEIVARVVSERAREEWRARGDASPGRTIEDLLQLLWEPLRAKGLAYTAEPCGEGIQLRCTRCPVVEMARALGDTEWLFLLTCGADPAIAEGFNPAIGLRRTRTLMEGHDCCDHFYFLKEPAGQPEGRGANNRRSAG